MRRSKRFGFYAELVIRLIDRRLWFPCAADAADCDFWISAFGSPAQSAHAPDWRAHVNASDLEGFLATISLPRRHGSVLIAKISLENTY